MDPNTLKALQGAAGGGSEPYTGDIAVTHDDPSPYITAYPWTSGTGFGTKYSDPATLPAGDGIAVAFSPAA